MTAHPGVRVLDHPLIQHKLTLLRDRETSTIGFRRIAREISLLMAYEVTRDLALELVDILTPLEPMAAPQIAHMVFFKLKDQSPNAREKLVAACDKLVTGMTGIVHYSAGVLGDNYEPAVSDRAFDVALHLVFEDKAAHAKYLPHPQHKQFIEEHKASFAGVRVFDSEVKPKAK